MLLIDFRWRKWAKKALYAYDTIIFYYFVKCLIFMLRSKFLNQKIIKIIADSSSSNNVTFPQNGINIYISNILGKFHIWFICNIFFPNAIFCHNKYLVMSPFSNYIPILYKYLPNNLFPLTVLYNPRTCE